MLHISLFRTSPRSCLRLLNESGTAILFVIVLAVIGSIVISSAFFSSRITIKASGVRREKVAVVNIAEAGKEHVLGSLRNRDFNPVASQDTMIYTNKPFGSGAYSVRCITNAGNDTIRIISTGKCGDDSIKIEVIATLAPDAWRRWINGAVTSRNNVSTLGSIEVDGRDYDTTSVFGTLLGTRGVYGVCAGGTVTAGGSSKIGGNTTAPQQPALPEVTVQENIDTVGYPQTPEEVLGLPAGALDSYKVTTCPSSSFFGIVYSDNPCDFAGGIMICHNASGTASLGNYHGHFKGIIITDEVNHFNGGSSVLGAVFFLGKTVGGNCDGNGGSRIRYSSRMLNKVMNQYLSPAGSRNVTVVSWREVN